MRFTEILSIVAGSMIGLFGAVLVAGSFLQPPGTHGIVGQVVMTVMFGLLPIVVGAYLIWKPLHGRRRRDREALERSVLELSAASGGALTPAQVARNTELTLDEAKAFLDSMVLSGHAVSDMRDDGQIGYRFPDAGTG